ncbi:MAG TPA: hypothetical protein VIL43_12300, partial [Burkholderiales bacterium]
GSSAVPQKSTPGSPTMRREARDMTGLPRVVVAASIVVLVGVNEARADGGAETGNPALTDAGMARAWRALRAMDCSRCHGKDYNGLAAPSIVEYARTQSREMFLRAVLEGNPPRGMPGYRDNPSIAGCIDDIYRYFLGRAYGTIGPESRPRSGRR